MNGFSAAMEAKTPGWLGSTFIHVVVLQGAWSVTFFDPLLPDSHSPWFQKCFPVQFAWGWWVVTNLVTSALEFCFSKLLPYVNPESTLVIQTRERVSFKNVGVRGTNYVKYPIMLNRPCFSYTERYLVQTAPSSLPIESQATWASRILDKWQKITQGIRIFGWPRLRQQKYRLIPLEWTCLEIGWRITIKSVCCELKEI